ncbi:MAG: hypothetical protein DBY32_08895 [Phascolarctobacterium sp.]|nr:MAG: hypothetical protein DBY32_08895 [Phascolarctobacterium sp.]
MNKTELVAAVAEKTGLTKKDAEKALGALLETIKEEVAKDEKVQLIGFGTFEARKRNARTGKNPQTGGAIEIPAATVPAFKAGKAFKDMVNAK